MPTLSLSSSIHRSSPPSIIIIIFWRWPWPRPPGLNFWGLFHCFLSLRCSLKICVLQKSYLWEFQVETLYMCPKPCFGWHTAMLWAHIQSFSLIFSSWMWFSGIVYFCEIVFESSRNVSETTPWTLSANYHYLLLSNTRHTFIIRCPLAFGNS